jgi:hypothetical protein
LQAVNKSSEQKKYDCQKWRSREWTTKKIDRMEDKKMNRKEDTWNGGQEPRGMNRKEDTWNGGQEPRGMNRKEDTWNGGQEPRGMNHTEDTWNGGQENEPQRRQWTGKKI